MKCQPVSCLLGIADPVFVVRSRLQLGQIRRMDVGFLAPIGELLLCCRNRLGVILALYPVFHHGVFLGKGRLPHNGPAGGRIRSHYLPDIGHLRTGNQIVVDGFLLAPAQSLEHRGLGVAGG